MGTIEPQTGPNIMWNKVFLLTALTSVVALACPASEAKAQSPFAADHSINAQGILRVAKASHKDVLASFPASSGSVVPIFGDWLNLPNVSAFHFLSDMQVDCDGVDFKCKGNPDGQPATSFGHLDARKVPYMVVPLQFSEKEGKKLKPNALAAVICNGKMFYSIYADQNGDKHETIGEASELLAQTCFPSDGLDGGTGHDTRDVLYIVFGQQVPPGVGDKTINISALKALGDAQAKKLAAALGV